MLFMTLLVFVVLILLAAGAAKGAGSTVLASQLRRVAMGLGGLALILLVTSTITIVKAGHVGVVDLFGRVSTYTLKSGLQIVNPLARVIQMSVQTLEIKERMEVPSKEGMTMVIEVSVLYHLDPEKAADVYRTVGEDFVGVILEPQFRSITRGVTASYEAKALYTSEREAVAKLILDDLKQLVGSKFDRNGREVLLQTLQLRGTRNRNDPRFLSKDPCEG